ncbi:hypothetical protein PoB_000879700 [Plakobranchus ocellatus]|uniref:Uncharacterized protein n=1 Tax=Plakobranchus ocellatus TaxID=259542 RepID=A0AAV3YHG1_9GAST|nr:hypothetical protein PoB_000879700 [Plakobranchus ocellatus]
MKHILFSKGSPARKLGYLMKILKSQAIQGSDKSGIDYADNFLSLYDPISAMAAKAGQSLERERFNKPRSLPCCKDVQKLYSFVKSINAVDYPSLAKVALCEILLFNRKRGGEIQRMTMKTIQTLEKGMRNQVRQMN